MTRGNSGKLTKLVQPWQQDAFRFYGSVGECWYAAQFYARALVKLRLFAAIENDQGEVEEIKDMGHPAVQALDRVQDRGGGRSQILGNYGRLMFLTGEGYLVCTITQPDDDEEGSELDPIETWEFLSVNELRLTPGGGYSRLKAPGTAPINFDDLGDNDFGQVDGDSGGRVWRMWRRSPEFSGFADSPMRATMALFEELVLLQLAVRARAKARLAVAGILYVSHELSFPTPTGINDEDPLADPFMAELARLMVAPIIDPGSAGAVVPIVVRGPTPTNESTKPIFHIKIHDPDETYQEREQITEIIKRIATGLDLPPELLLGMTDANHWTAWQIDEQTWTAHLQPVAQALVDDLTSAYLQPAMRAEGVENWNRIVVGYDAAAIVNHPDRGKDALQLFKEGLLNGAGVREAMGFTEDDKQTEEEHLEWLAIMLRDQSLITGEETEDPNVPEGEVVDQSNEVVKQPPSEEILEQEDPNEIVGSSSFPIGNGAALSSTDVAALVLESIYGAAAIAADHSREKAGSRLRGKAKGCDTCQVKIDRIPNAMVPVALGIDVADEIGAPGAAQLVAGGADGFKRYLMKCGVEIRRAEKLGDIVEEHVAKTLFQDGVEPLPMGFRVTASKLLAGHDV